MKGLALPFCALMAVASSSAGAEDKFPTKPIKMIIGFAPGSMAAQAIRGEPLSEL